MKKSKEIIKKHTESENVKYLYDGLYVVTYSNGGVDVYTVVDGRAVFICADD